MRLLLSFVSLCALLAAAPSCAAPLQNGRITVSPGAEARLDLMCRYRADSSGGAQQVCAAESEE